MCLKGQNDSSNFFSIFHPKVIFFCIFRLYRAKMENYIEQRFDINQFPHSNQLLISDDLFGGIFNDSQELKPCSNQPTSYYPMKHVQFKGVVEAQPHNLVVQQHEDSVNLNYREPGIILESTDQGK